MAVFFRASDSGINFEVAEYQEFPRPEPEDAPTETPKPSKSSSGTYDIM